MNDSKRVWVWVGVVVVVAVVAAWIVWKPAPKQQASVPVPVYASQGQLVPQFPKGLILDSAAAISGSYSIGYSSSTNQYTAEYDSSSTVTSLFAQYKTYLSANGWTITGTLTSHPTFDVIAASQGNDQLQVVISTAGKGSQVVITYVVENGALPTQASNWINVASSSFPPHMITGILVARGAAVVTDRYYDDSSGAEHGEYAFELPLSAQNSQSNLYSTYMTLLENSIKTNKQITVQSQTSSSIALTETGYAATITFSNPNSQIELVDIMYNQILPK